MPDVFKILKDLELKAVGLDPETNKMQEGYFVSFRSVGLPIHKDDFKNPFSPLGSHLAAAIPPSEPADPAAAPTTASGQMDENKIAVANVAKSMKTYLNTFLLTDDQLVMNNQYAVMPSAAKISDAWYAIITGANGIPTQSDLSPELKQAYERAQAKLVDENEDATRHYEKYMEYEEEYREKVRAWHKAYADAFTDPMKLSQWPVTGVAYHDEADEAFDRWVALGHKEEIENALAILAAQGTDPAIALIGRAKKRFINSLNEFQGVGQIPYTMMLPESWYDPDNDDGWNVYASSDWHSETHYETSSTSYSGHAGINLGFFSIGGSFNHAESQASLDMQADDVNVSFSYCVVDIKRPWLDTSLLNLHNWFLVGDYKRGCISDGTMGQQLPQNAVAFMPSIVTSLIFIKDLRISWSNWKSQWDAAMSQTRGSASVGWGPFAVSGRYSHHDEQRDFTADASGESLEVPGIQLIGYVSAINPVSPWVDSSEYLEQPQH